MCRVRDKMIEFQLIQKPINFSYEGMLHCWLQTLGSNIIEFAYLHVHKSINTRLFA